MLTPKQAAERSGWSRPTIMNALKNKELHGVRDNRNHWKIRGEDLSEWMDSRSQSVRVTSVSPSDTQVVEMKGKVQVLEAELRGKDALIDQLRSDLDHARSPFWRRFFSK